MVESHADYGLLAWFYNRYWGREFHGAALAIFDRIMKPQLHPAARVLDVCCGTGHFTEGLAARGYSMAAMDLSPEMLLFARRRLPGVPLFAADVCNFAVRRRFDAVVCTFESLNHILEAAGLERAVANMQHVLKRDGLLMFDMIFEEAYIELWGRTSAIVEDDNICIVRGGYDEATRIGETRITMLRHDGAWRRSDVLLRQRCYLPEQVTEALQTSGFQEIASFRAREDLDMPGDLAVGRLFFRARTGAP